jgi:putative transposase
MAGGAILSAGFPRRRRCAVAMLAIHLAIRSCYSPCRDVIDWTPDLTRPAPILHARTSQTGAVSLLIRRLQVRVLPGARQTPRSAAYGTCFACSTGDDPLFRHVHTRVRSPQTNGVVERFFGTLKYEHLYRATIGDGNALAVEVNLFRHTCNTLRPHQALDERRTRAAYLAVVHCDWRVAFGGPAT